MELIMRKLGNSTGLTFPAAFLRELRLVEGQVISVSTQQDGSIVLRPKATRKRFTAAELNAQCDLKQAMPIDLDLWDRMPAVGSETE